MAKATSGGHVLALDQGTTSSRAIVFDRAGVPVAMAQAEFPQHYGDGGTGAADMGIVEHDPEDIWRTQLDCGRRALAEAGLAAADVAAIGITNQRETAVLWERSTGRAVAPAIVWQSRVSAPICARLRQAGVEEEVRARTGLVLDPYFSATKIVHLLETLPGLRERCRRGDVLFGTVDSFLVWRLTGGRVHATDPTNASRTLLYDIDARAWSDRLAAIFDVPPAMLPEVRPSSGTFGDTDPEWFGGPIAIRGCAGDQQSAAYAHGCFRPGEAKNTYGTGAFLLSSTGSRRVASTSGLLSTLACGPGPGAPPIHALEGSVFIAGALVGWLRDGLGLIATSADVEVLARSVPDSGGLVIVPALTGLGAPHWDPAARGMMIGLTRATGRGHVARAALEAIALSVADVVSAIERDSGQRLERLRVDGGASDNDLLLQIQADTLGIPVERPVVRETTALGAALLAGRAAGVYGGHDDVRGAAELDGRFMPREEPAAGSRRRRAWDAAIGRARGWLEAVERS